MRLRAAAAGPAALLLSFLVLGASGAQAAPALHCEASPLRATVLGSQTIEPVTQGRGAACATGEAVPSLSTPLLNASALTAHTAFDPSGPSGGAAGGIASLQVLPTPEILAAGRQQIVDFVNALPLQPISLPIPIRLPAPLPSITGVTLDLRAALLSLIPPPATSLLSADVATASAGVTCASGTPQFTGTSTVAGLSVLGQSVSADAILNTVAPLINARTISIQDLLNTNLVRVFQGTVTDPTGLTALGGPLLSQVLAAIAAPLAAIPPITLPASLADVQIHPNEQLADGSSLTQRALHVSISLVGQPILDAVLGEAKVGADAGACPVAAPVASQGAVVRPAARPVAAQSAADQLLQCSDRKLVLVDVLKEGGHVKLLGAANRDYVGKKVAIRLRRGNKVVAHAVVKKDGSFETTAPLPPAAVMASHTASNSLRYRAEIGKELSLPLKLQRRLVVSSLTSRAGRVTIKGRVVRPLTTPASEIRLVRRVSCHKVVLVKRFKPRSDGTFAVTVKAPAGASAAVYRLATYVREKASNPRRYPTFTLPRGVDLAAR
jgi:hypothetical protein